MMGFHNNRMTQVTSTFDALIIERGISTILKVLGFARVRCV